jgi:predicted Zn-dependent protease
MQAATGRGPPAFLSTHPSHKQRIRDLENRVPSVMNTYNAARKPQC